LRARAILVVDDEPLLVRVLVRLLTDEGFDVVGANDGAQALRCVDERAFDLILCDVRMPVMDGPALLRALIARGRPFPPLVFLTGHATTDDVDLLGLGARAVRGKPVDTATLLALIAAHAAE
jgi:two-component system response regulator AtoC